MRWLLALLPTMALAQSAEPPAVPDKTALPDMSATTPDSRPAEQQASEESPSHTDASTTQPAGNDSSSAQTTSDVTDEKAFSANGYKRVEKDGQAWYCRKEAEIGTRFKKTKCYTAEQLQQMAESGQDELRKNQKR